MNADAWRTRIVAGVLASPIVTVEDPALLAALADPAADCAFADLGFDSLARMELSIWLLMETGREVTEGELLEHQGVAALAAHLAATPA